MQQRLQKILARAGVASRRSAERFIEAGRVRVNGKTIRELGTRADPRLDRIEVDGKRLVAENPVFILLHKPRAVMSTLNDPEGRPTVADLFSGLPLRIFPVGRLDYQTSGALLMTNDGDFTARVLHPRYHVPKTYLVKVKGEMQRADIDRWRKGITLEDGLTLPAEAFISKRERGHTWFELILREGRNQQVRRMGEASGFPVIRLTRTAFANLGIDKLHAGQWRFLTIPEMRDLRSLYGVPKHIRAAARTHTELARLQPTRGQTSFPIHNKKPSDPQKASDTERKIKTNPVSRGSKHTQRSPRNRNSKSQNKSRQSRTQNAKLFTHTPKGKSSARSKP